MINSEKYTAVFGKDNSIFVIDHSDNFTGESVSVYRLLHNSHQHQMVIHLEIEPDLSTDRNAKRIKIVDLEGGGSNSNLCNKGYGSELAGVAFSHVKKLYSFQEPNSISVVGRLSDVQDESEDDHTRRVHFWKKMGMTVKDESDHFSTISSSLNSCYSVELEAVELRAQSLLSAFKEAQELVA